MVPTINSRRLKLCRWFVCLLNGYYYNGFREKIFGALLPPPPSAKGGGNQGTEAAEWVARGKGCPLSSGPGGLGSISSSSAVSEAESRPEMHFGVFESHITLLFAPDLCQCVEFVKQCFGRGFEGQMSSCLNLETRLRWFVPSELSFCE